MPVLLPNVYFDTQRATYNPTTGVTAAASDYLSGQLGHIKHVGTSQIHAITYGFLPEGALRSDFILCTDDALDVLYGDIVHHIVLLDQVTPWPAPESPNEFWRVEYVHHTPPGVLVHRECYIARITGGGLPT